MKTNWINSPLRSVFQPIEHKSFDVPVHIINYMRHRIAKGHRGYVTQDVFQHGKVIGQCEKQTYPPGMKGKSLINLYYKDFVPNILGCLLLSEQYLNIAMRAPDPTRLILEIPHYKRDRVRLFYENGTGNSVSWKLVGEWTINWNWLLSLTDFVNLVYTEKENAQSRLSDARQYSGRTNAAPSIATSANAATSNRSQSTNSTSTNATPAIGRIRKPQQSAGSCSKQPNAKASATATSNPTTFFPNQPRGLRRY